LSRIKLKPSPGRVDSGIRASAKSALLLLIAVKGGPLLLQIGDQFGDPLIRQGVQQPCRKTCHTWALPHLRDWQPPWPLLF
jgi:hypothetical protein